MEKCVLCAIRTTGMAVNLMSDIAIECHYKLSHTEKNHRFLEQGILQQYELSFKKALDRDKIRFNAQSNLYFCRALLINYNTISHKHQSFCNGPFVSKARHLSAAVNVQQY